MGYEMVVHLRISIQIVYENLNTVVPRQTMQATEEQWGSHQRSYVQHC